MRVRPGRSPGSAAAGRTGGATRVAVVAVLLAVAVAGLRAHGTFSRAAHSAAAGAIASPLAVLLATGEGIALVAFVIVLAMARPQRKKNPDTDEPWRPPFPWWAKTLAVLVALVAEQPQALGQAGSGGGIVPDPPLHHAQLSENPGLAAPVAEVAE